MIFTQIQISLGEKPVGRFLFVSTEGVFLLRVVVGLGVVRLGWKETGDRSQETGVRSQNTGDRIQETGLLIDFFLVRKWVGAWWIEDIF